MKFAKEVFVTSNCEVIDHTIPDCSSVVDLSYDTDSDVNVGMSAPKRKRLRKTNLKSLKLVFK
jgi:hypothetical protein